MNSSAETQMGTVFRWALESACDPAMAAANWLASDIDPECESAVDLIADHTRPLEQLQRAKMVFKTLRIVGETGADRRLGGRLYVASIAAALVRHNQRITTQSEAALQRGFSDLAHDSSLPESLRGLGEMALAALELPPTKTSSKLLIFDRIT